MSVKLVVVSRGSALAESAYFAIQKNAVTLSAFFGVTKKRRISVSFKGDWVDVNLTKNCVTKKR